MDIQRHPPPPSIVSGFRVTTPHDAPDKHTTHSKHKTYDNQSTEVKPISTLFTGVLKGVKDGVSVFVSVLIFLLIMAVLFDLKLGFYIGKSDTTFEMNLTVKDKNIQTNIISNNPPTDSVQAVE
jgi:hypothetical protein